MSPIRQQLFRVGTSRNGFTLLLAGLLVCACEGAPARSKPWRHAESHGGVAPTAVPAAGSPGLGLAASPGSRLSIHLAEDPGHLHPMLRPTRAGRRIVMGTVFETLIRYRPPAGGGGAGPGSYQPGLAAAWKVSPSGREIRLELQPEAEFHDGRRVTAVDVQFSIDSARHPRIHAPQHRRALADVSAVEIVGPKTVRIRLSQKNGYVLRELAEIPILPEHVYEKRGNATGGPLVGSGPYRVEEVGDEGIVLTAHDNYWGPAPKVQTIAYVRQTDAARALIAAKDGALDIVPQLIPEHYPGQLEAPGIAAAFQPVRWRPGTFQYLVVNCTGAPFDDRRVRQAVSLLMPRDRLVQQRRGLARAVVTPVWPGGPGDGDAALVPEGDQSESAAALLDAAGWRQAGSDGVRERGGRRLMITVLATNEDPTRRDLVLKSLKQAGFVIDLRIGTAGVLLKRLRDGRFDLGFAEWSGMVDRDLSPLLSSTGKNNFGRCAEPRIDSILARMRAELDPQGRAPLAAELAIASADALPLIGLTAPEPVGLIRRRVRGAVAFGGWLAAQELSLAAEND